MAAIRWTDEAILWLSEIHEYISRDSLDAAQQVVEGITHKAETLEIFPQAGYRFEHQGRELRILLYGHYRIAYLIKPSGDIDILGVYHGALDLARHLPSL
ncbi:MAG TPA: type II toxin-antitoxin system RelE/ParE family toxin [Thermoanaerobaculia bacterium]|nr:type II toxin-antitoxin system RelE/ParE family toxin [Thermoanaerobaculia bacterium]